MKTNIIVLLSVIASSASAVQAQTYGGINFPGGLSSFADSVISYDCSLGGKCPAPAFQDTTQALGAPDGGILSLGFSGIVELRFTNNVLTNSGSTLNDLHVFEVGADVEPTLVAVRPTSATAVLLGPAFDANADGYYEVGQTSGGTSSIDIDVFFPGFQPGALRFDAVQLIDIDNNSAAGGTDGADIDAVGAIESIPVLLLGDVNQNGVVDFLDISPFIQILTTSTYLEEADCNQDGSVTFLDIPPLIEILSGN